MSSSPAHRYKQSGVIAYRKNKDKGRIEIMMISNRRRSRWVIPKGMIARGYDARTSAAKEALEEAGILGKVSKRRIGRYTYKKWGGVCMVTVYLMRVDTELKTWEEMDRQRRWVSVSKARRLIDEKKLQKLISKIPHIVTSGYSKLKKVHGIS